VSAVDACEQAEIQQQERRGDAPVDVSRPEDLPAHVVVGVGDVLVVVLDSCAVVVGGVAGSHGKVRNGGGNRDQGGNNVVETLRNGDAPGSEREDGRGDDHDNEDDPEGTEAVVRGILVLGRSRDDGRNGLDAAVLSAKDLVHREDRVSRGWVRENE